MDVNGLINNTFLKNNVIANHIDILRSLKTEVHWDNSIKSRKTASFGLPYNYSNTYYDYIEMPAFLNDAINLVFKINGFIPNNCLINYYFDNSSKMGYHSDQIDLLENNTGVVIISLGSSRILRFKNKHDKSIIFDFNLSNNSYFYMSQEVQKNWLHSILQDDNSIPSERFSLTFRKILK
ncbi:alpha-ketoglutarate-dependent dioxygenase AlkB [Flavobacterium sp.]|uniref:alpha-ketoglutarate-dependent dioxygenase AlkB n=1 Tax=Flavobacterium sp. TaxID=239 RepID=UPI003F6A2C0E